MISAVIAAEDVDILEEKEKIIYKYSAKLEMCNTIII